MTAKKVEVDDKPYRWEIVINHTPPPKVKVNPEDAERKRRLDAIAYQRELRRIANEGNIDAYD